jgi:antitoxin component of MazEF toxin-antitoxin module
VIKWEKTLIRRGGSAYVAIPPEIARALQWQLGDPLEIWVDENLQAAIIKKKGVPRGEVKATT